MMLDIQRTSTPSLRDVEAEIDRLLLPDPFMVAAAARYHFAGGGSLVRAQLGLGAAAALNLSPQAALACAVAPELLHNASLVHDDLQDGDVMRRNQPAVWSRYGKNVALSTGDLLISAAYMAIAKHPDPAAALCAMHDTVVLTIGGQTEDCRTEQPSPEKYATIAAHKSGPLLALPIRLALTAAGLPGQDIASQAAFALAVAYQTLDDISDRSADFENGTTNICLALEADGHSQAAAHVLAIARARTALKTARHEASALLNGVGAPLLALADRLETQLKELANAT